MKGGYIRGIPLMPGFFVLLSFLAKESREEMILDLKIRVGD